MAIIKDGLPVQSSSSPSTGVAGTGGGAPALLGAPPPGGGLGGDGPRGPEPRPTHVTGPGPGQFGNQTNITYRSAPILVETASFACIEQGRNEINWGRY